MGRASSERLIKTLEKTSVMLLELLLKKNPIARTRRI